MALPENRPPSVNLTPEQMKQGIRRLEIRRAEVEEFDFEIGSSSDNAEYLRNVSEDLHARSVVSALARVFGDTIESRQYADHAASCWDLLVDRYGVHVVDMSENYRSSLEYLLDRAKSVLSEELDVATAGHTERRYGETETKPGDRRSARAASGDKVFIVHGHDRAARSEVARFIEQLKLDAIILDEQPSQGRTIIEKFEDHAEEVGFAVVIMTPDDTVTEPSSATRARQNVIYELGYFSGKLGRDRSCVLRKGDVEIPSDLYGVVYIDLDIGGGWRVKLAKELRAAGLKIDTERML
jgi:predicted nucleotide-binding protein